MRILLTIPLFLLCVVGMLADGLAGIFDWIAQGAHRAASWLMSYE